MRGELLPIWPDLWPNLWLKLNRRAKTHPDLFCELYRELNSSLAAPNSIEDLADITDDPNQAKREFRRTKSSAFKGERALVNFLESCHEVLDDLGGDSLANDYFILLEAFLEQFSVRYELRRPCSLCPTLPGLFARLICDLRVNVQGDAHLGTLLAEFESAIRDLQADRAETKLKICIQKQMNLLEGLGRNMPGVQGSTLGSICDQVGTWPHAKLKEALKSMYGFASDYPGIRHGGTPGHAIRSIQIRDLVAVTVALAGLSSYVTPNFDGDRVYIDP
jgi:hypothetical protein